MFFVDMIYDNITWIFSGVGLVVSGFIFRISKPWITKKILLGRRSIENTGADHPFIEREFELGSGNPKLYLITFVPNKNREHSFEEKWVEHEHVPIEIEDNEIKISKSKIKDHLENVKYPFKFVIEVDYEKEVIGDYYQKLISVIQNLHIQDKWLFCHS